MIAASRKKYGVHTGVETPITPDGPDVLDGANAVEGLGVIGLAWRRIVECVGLRTANNIVYRNAPDTELA
jgi:hypothetical protein